MSREIESERERREKEKSSPSSHLNVSPYWFCLAPLQNQFKKLPFRQSSVIGIL